MWQITLGSPVPLGPWVQQWLFTDRFAPYVTETGGNLPKALDLYEWNTAMAATIMHDLAHLEVAIRNTYDAALVAHQAGSLHWTQDPFTYFPVSRRTANNGDIYDENERPRKQLDYAVRSAGSGAPTGKVIAELSFGFWRYLTVAAREGPMWVRYLRHGFAVGTVRRDIDIPMSRLHMLRNRVAHHEPLLTANLTARRNDVIELLGRISPDLRSYVDSVSTWAAVEAQRP